jgi:energy-coupling factor transport system substrate-specific component
MFTTPRLILIALGAALNCSIGTIVYLVKLPIYLDSIGTILVALLLAPDRMAAFVCAWAAGWVGLAVSGLINPFLPWFALTDVAIAGVAALLIVPAAATFRARPLRSGSFAMQVALCGVVTGVVSAVVSAPVVVYLFGGITGSGSALVVALFLKDGLHLMSAAILSGLAADPLDKILQVLLAALLYRATPADFIALLRADTRNAAA